MEQTRFIFFILFWVTIYLHLEPQAFPNTPPRAALAMMDEENFALAAEHLESLVTTSRLKSEVQEIHHLLGYCYEQLEKWEQVTEHLQMATSPHYILADYAIYHLARAYQKSKDYANAITWYQRLIERYPQSFHLFAAEYGIARGYLQQEDYANALEYFSQLATNAKSGYVRNATYGQAQAYEGLEKWKKALHAYQHLIDADTSDQVARNAFEQLQRLTKSHPDFRITRSQHIAHGMLFYNRGKFKDSIPKFQAVAAGKKDKLAGKATYYIGRAYHRQRKYDLAIKEYNKVSALYPASGYLTRSLYQTTICYRRKGQPAIAQKRLKTFVKDYSWSELADNALYDLGWVQENEGQFDEAIESYRQLPQRYSRSQLASDAYWRIGWIQFKNKQYNESLETFASLIRLFPGNRLAMAAHFWTAKCHERKNQQEIAEKIYREVAAADHWYYSSRAEAVLSQMGKEPEIVKNALASSRLKVVSNHPEWKRVGSNRSPRVGKLMGLRLYEDAITEIRGKIRSDRVDPKDGYYNLIVCYQKRRKFKQAYDYAGVLSRFKSMRDENQAIPLELYQLLYPIYYTDVIDKYSEKYEMDRLFVAAMILEESHYGAKLTSWAGALGLMQIMPQTGRELARQLKIRRFRNDMLFDPEVNIEMGTKYMKSLMDRFEGNYALVAGAYNGGPGRMGRWVKEMKVSDLDEFIEDISISETRRHIKKVLDSYHVYQRLYASKTTPHDSQMPKTHENGENETSGG